jgi:pilus assembly protein CpaB
MNRRLLTILVIAFVIAAICTWVVTKLVGSRMAAVAAPTSTQVVAAAQDIKLGALITEKDLTTTSILGPLPKGALLKKEQALNRGVISDMYQGEAILENRLAPVGSGGGLAATIPPGMRAAAVKVDDVEDVSGFAIPGMHVDVLISGMPPDEQNGAQTTGQKVKTILQNLAVLSAGTDIEKDAQGKPKPVQVVNLLVTPEQAEILSLAAANEKIQLVLRNPLDNTVTAPPGTMVKNLFTDIKGPAPVKKAAAPAPKKAADPSYSIEVINGNTKSDQKFATPGGKQ